MELAEIASLLAALISAISLFKSMRDKRFDKIDQRFDSLDRRFGRLEDSMQNMKVELKKEIFDMRTELKGEISQVREEMKIMKYELKKESFDARGMFVHEIESLDYKFEEAKKEVKIDIQLVRQYSSDCSDDILEQIFLIRSDTSEIRERLSFLEALAFVEEFSDNPRSEGAKRMWQRRRTKKIEHRKED